MDTDVFNGTMAQLQSYVIGGGNPPPVISNVQAINVTSTAATITWTTDAASSSQVQYGLTSAYGNSSTLNNTPVTAHSVALSGLTANKLYHYRAISTNAYGTSYSSDATFTTAVPPPTISMVAVNSIGADTATITWTTNVPATSQVQYGLTTTYGSQTPLDSNLVTAHSLVLTALTPKTLYHYQALSTSANGSAQSLDLTFTTAGVPAISGVSAGELTDSAATITWTTDVSADSQVEYGTSNAYGANSLLDANLVTSHRVRLSGLATTTLYHYRVRSANGSDTARSDDYTFTTTPVPQGSSPPVSQVPLSVPPGASSVTSDRSTGCPTHDTVWTAVGGFGADTVQYYAYAWDQNPSYSFMGSEPTWSSGALALKPSGPGSWYLHVHGFNSADVANGTCDYTITVTDADGDGTADCQDGCPNDPGKTAPGRCGCGTPDVDSDGDGVPDCVDNCPSKANLLQADSDGNGVGDACEPVGASSPLQATGCGTGASSVLLACVSILLVRQVVSPRHPRRPKRDQLSDAWRSR